MSKLKKILLGLFMIFVVIQFFQPAKNQHTSISGKNMAAVLPIDDSVASILKVSCADCHSNNTKYPWYANIQPVAWWLNNHIEEGKAEWNMDGFADYSLRKQYHKLEEIGEQVEEGEMPLKSYSIIHQSAALTSAEKETLLKWVTHSRKWMQQKYPADSLLKKK